MKLELSLHKANKFRQLLVTKFAKMNQVTGSVSASIKNTSLEVEIQDILNNKIKEQEEINVLSMDILNTEATLKKLIFNANSKTGVSDLLEDIKLVKNKISIFEAVVNSQKTAKKIDKLDIKNVVEVAQKSEDHYFSKVLVAIVDVNTEEIPILKKELRKLEDECNLRNISNTIEIEISEVLATEFGY